MHIYKKHFTEPYANVEKLPISENTKALFQTKNKIIVRGVSQRLTGMIDYEGIGLLVAVHSIITNKEFSPEFVLGLINSKFLNWIHKERFYLGRIPEGSLKYPVSFYKELPIPKNPEQKDKDELESLVKQNIKLGEQLNAFGDKDTDARRELETRTSKVETSIDDIVYRLYKLTDAEIKTVDSGD